MILRRILAGVRCVGEVDDDEVEGLVMRAGGGVRGPWILVLVVVFVLVLVLVLVMRGGDFAFDFEFDLEGDGGGRWIVWAGCRGGGCCGEKKVWVGSGGEGNWNWKREEGVVWLGCCCCCWFWWVVRFGGEGGEKERRRSVGGSCGVMLEVRSGGQPAPGGKMAWRRLGWWLDGGLRVGVEGAEEKGEEGVGEGGA